MYPAIGGRLARSVAFNTATELLGDSVGWRGVVIVLITNTVTIVPGPFGHIDLCGGYRRVGQIVGRQWASSSLFMAPRRTGSF